MAYPSAGALIFKPPNPDPNTSVSGTRLPCDSARKWAEARQGGRLLCSRLIRFHSTPSKYQSAGLYTRPSVRLCVCSCGSGSGRVLCVWGRRTRESIAGSEGNVSLSAESIHSHQTGSLSITGELREHTLSFFLSSYVCLFASAGPVPDGITIAHVRAFGNRDGGRYGGIERPRKD